MDKPNEVFMTDAQIQELAYGIAEGLPFSIAQIQRVEGVLKRIRAVYEGNGYEPTLEGEMWEPLEDKAYTMPDGKYLATDGNRLIVKRAQWAPAEEYIKLPSSVRLCKRTSKTLKKE